MQKALLNKEADIANMGHHGKGAIVPSSCALLQRKFVPCKRQGLLGLPARHIDRTALVKIHLLPSNHSCSVVPSFPILRYSM